MLFWHQIHVALDRNPRPGYNTLLLRLIPGDLLSACPHTQIHILPRLLDSRWGCSVWLVVFYVPSTARSFRDGRAALLNSYPNALRAKQGGSLDHFYDGFGYDPAGTWTRDLSHKRQTYLPLSQPDSDQSFVIQWKPFWEATLKRG